MARQQRVNTAEPTALTVALALPLLVSVSLIALTVSAENAYAQTVWSSPSDGWASSSAGSTQTSKVSNGQFIGLDTSGNATVVQGTGVTVTNTTNAAAYGANGLALTNGASTTTVSPTSISISNSSGTTAVNSTSVTTGAVNASTITGGSLSTTSVSTGALSVSGGGNSTSITPTSVTTGAVYAGNLSSTGNITANGTLSVSNGGNSTTITPTSVTTGTVHANNLDVASLSVTNLNTSGNISATSVSTTQNITAGGNITATGDISSNSVTTGTVNASNFKGGTFTGDALVITDGTHTSSVLPNSISTTGSLQSASLTTGAISTTGITSTGAISTTGAVNSASVNTGALNATTVTASTINADTLNTTNFNSTNLGTQHLTVSDGTNTTTITPTSVSTSTITTDHIYIKHSGGTNYIDMDAAGDKVTLQGMTFTVQTAGGSSITNITDGAINASDSVTTKALSAQTGTFSQGMKIASASATPVTIDDSGNVSVGTGTAVTKLSNTGDVAVGRDLTVTGATKLANLTIASGATVNMGGAVVHNVATPIDATDAANKEYVDSVLGDTGSRIATLGRKVDETQEGVAIALALAQPVFTPGQNFAFRVGWGNFEGENAIGLSGAGVIARNAFGAGTIVALDGGFGFGTSQGTVAGRAGVTFGW